MLRLMKRREGSEWVEGKEDGWVAWWLYVCKMAGPMYARDYSCSL
jgi:hypothetical protein